MLRVDGIPTKGYSTSAATRELPDNRYWTTEEAAYYLQLCVGTIYNLVRQGDIPSHKVRGKRLFAKAELDAWVRRGERICCSRHAPSAKPHAL